MESLIRSVWFTIAVFLLSASAAASGAMKAGGALVSGNSVLIVGSDGALVVDSGHVPSVTKRMIADIARLTNKPVRFLVNTHWHPDHVTGNSPVTAALESLSQQAHAAVKQGLTQEQFQQSVDMARFRSEFASNKRNARPEFRRVLCQPRRGPRLPRSQRKPAQR